MLTDLKCRTAKAAERDYRMPDQGGLHLFVTTAGAKVWRLRYKFQRREKTLAFGPYPAVSLADARLKREEAKAALRAGRDPGKRSQAGEPFESVARRWHKLREPTWAKVHAADVIHSLERDAFPPLGARPLAEIGVPDVLAILRGVEDRGAVETAHRLRQRISAVFAFAIAEGGATTDPAAMVKGALRSVEKGRQPAVVTLDGVRAVLRAAEAIPAHATTRLALRLLALTAARPGEIRGATWQEFTLDDLEPTWTIPAARMKARREHVIPLSRQASEVLDALRGLTGDGPWCFPSVRHAAKPMSENAIGYLLNRAGFHGHHVPHGWRAAFSSVMNERRHADARIIDAMLAHAIKDKVEAAYNRAEHMALRRRIAQEWADILLEGFAPASSLLTLPAR